MSRSAYAGTGKAPVATALPEFSPAVPDPGFGVAGRSSSDNSIGASQQQTHLRPAARTLLLGLGNDILSDDSIGLRVAAALKERFAAVPEVSIMQTTEMGLALLDLVVGFDTLVIVDAVQTGKGQPGFIHEIDGHDLPTSPAVAPHFFGIGEMLALGAQVGLPVPSQVRIFGIEVADPFTIGTALSPALQSALPGIVERLASAVQDAT